jgi:hypothetical protein
MDIATLALAKKLASSGAPGQSAYELAVQAGFEGTEKDWLDSLKGENGVYVGSEEPTNTSDNIWIDPSAESVKIIKEITEESTDSQIPTAQATYNLVN